MSGMTVLLNTQQFFQPNLGSITSDMLVLSVLSSQHLVLQATEETRSYIWVGDKTISCRTGLEEASIMALMLMRYSV